MYVYVYTAYAKGTITELHLKYFILNIIFWIRNLFLLLIFKKIINFLVQKSLEFVDLLSN